MILFILAFVSWSALAAASSASANAASFYPSFAFGEPDRQQSDTGAQGAGKLLEWTQGLKVPIPANSTFALPMNMGDLTVSRGYCHGLRVANILPRDNSSDLVLEFGIYLSSVGIACHIEGESQGFITIDVVVADTSMNASVQIHPFYSQASPDLPLPLGYFNMTSCTADINVHNITVGGDSALAMLINGIGAQELKGIMGGFINQPLCDGVKNLIEINGTDALHEGASLMEPLLLPPQALPSPEPVGPLLDWATYPPIVVLKSLLDERFSVWANRFISVLDFEILRAKLVRTENVSLVITDMFIEGLITDQGTGLEVLTSGPSLGVFANLSGLALKGQLLLEVALPEQPVLKETLNVTIGLDNVSLTARAAVNEEELNIVAMDAEKAMESPACMLKSVEGTVTPQNESLALESMDVSLRPVFALGSTGELEKDATALLNSIVRSMYKGYLPSVNALVNGAIGLAREPLNQMLWGKIEALPPCSSANILLGLNEANIRSFWAVAIAAVSMGIVAAAFAHWRCPQKAAPKADDAAVDPNAEDMVSEASSATGAADASSVVTEVCLAKEPFVPAALAVFYPFAIVSVMFLFLYADLDLGATVSLVMAAEGRSTTIGPVFSFSLVSTIVHSWNSGAWVISVLTLLMSGVWPFVKLSLLLITWVLPPRRLSTKARGCIFGFLNTWGKYSFLDSWFLVLSMSAFAIQWESVSDAQLQVVTTPVAAFYVFFASTGLSLILGHVASECHTHAERVKHRRAEPAPLAAALAERVEAECSRDPRAAPATGLENSTPPVALSVFAASRVTRVVVASALGASMVLMLAGTFLVSFDFEISGIFIEFLFGHEVSRQYSLLGVGMAVSEGRQSNAGLLTLEVVFLGLAVVLPLVLLVALLILWLMPMKLLYQEALLRVCYVLDSWASLDVAVLVLVIANLEFGQMAEFLVYQGNLAAPCRLIKGLTRSECVQVGLTSRASIAILVVAAMGLLVLPKVTMRLCASAVFREARSPAVCKKVNEVVDRPQEQEQEVARVASE